MDPPTSDQPDWSITKAEWDRIAPGQPKVESAISNAAGVFVFVAALAGVISIAWAISTTNAWLVFGAVLISLALLTVSVQTYRRMSRSLGDWAGMHPVVWESRGCVCPWCQVRVDREPCPGHGFSTADQPALLAYWEALATRDSSVGIQMSDELRSTARTALDASSRTNWLFVRPLRAIAPGMFDAERSPLARACAAWPASLALLALLVVVAAILDAAFGRSAAMIPISGCWAVVLFPFAAAVAWKGWKPGPPRCAACGHLCATKQPTICPECGANLLRRGAIERGTNARSFPWAYVALVLLMWIVPSLVNRAVRALPISARNAIYSVTLPPFDYIRSLDPATLSAAEATDVADLIIHLAERQRKEAAFAWDFMPKAIAAGKLPPSYHEKAARASVRPSLTAHFNPQTAEVEVRVDANWGAPILGFMTSIRTFSGGYSTDGGKTWSRDWTQERSHELSRGRHEILVRAWIIVGPLTTHELPVGFDDRAAPILPDPAMNAYEVPLRTTVDVP